MTFHLTHNRQQHDGYEEVSPDQIVNKTGDVAVTLSAGAYGTECTVNIRNDDEHGSVSNLYTNIRDVGGAKVEAIALTLQPTTPPDAQPIKLDIIRNAQNQWDVKRQQGEATFDLFHQSATSIPYGRCRVVALDIQRSAARETPRYQDTTDDDRLVYLANGGRSGSADWFGRVRDNVAAATVKNIC